MFGVNGVQRLTAVSVLLQPAIMQPSTSEQPPPYSSADATPSAVAATKGVTDDLQRRQEELDRKAAEIDRREKELNSRHVLTSGIGNIIF